MTTPVRLAAFALGLAAVFGAAVGVGTAVGPVGAAAPAAMDAQHGADEEHAAAAAPALPAGLAVSEGGYTLALDAATLPAGAAAPVAFRLLGPDGQAVSAFDENHDEDLHLIAVRRDLSGFQHVHPDLGADGVWRTALDLTPGTWRLFADFVPSADGEKRTLGADLAVPGDYLPAPL